MKLKFTPTTHTVKAIIQAKIDQEETLLGEESSALELLNSKDLRLYNPYENVQKSDYAASIERRRNYIDARKMEVGLLDSHVAERVMVEFDL